MFGANRFQGLLSTSYSGKPPIRQVHYVSLKRKRVSPHVVRHGTAMALLESGVDIAVIALWLGHESIETTNAYLHANLAMKEKALAKVQPMDTPFRRFHADDRLLAFLESI